MASSPQVGIISLFSVERVDPRFRVGEAEPNVHRGGPHRDDRHDDGLVVFPGVPQVQDGENDEGDVVADGF